MARNLREFTPAVTIMGMAGVDPAGRRLLDLLTESGIDIAGVQQEAGVPTTVKTRIIARNQQVVRVDRERPHVLTERQTRRAMDALDRLIDGVDAIIVADYGKGFLTQPLADYICHAARRRQDPDGGPAPPHVALLAGRDSRKTEPGRSVSGGRTAALRSGDAGALRQSAARGRPAAGGAMGDAAAS